MGQDDARRPVLSSQAFPYGADRLVWTSAGIMLADSLTSMKPDLLLRVLREGVSVRVALASQEEIAQNAQLRQRGHFGPNSAQSFAAGPGMEFSRVARRLSVNLLDCITEPTCYWQYSSAHRALETYAARKSAGLCLIHRRFLSFVLNIYIFFMCTRISLHLWIT